MPSAPSVSAFSSAIETISSRPTNPELVDRITFRYLNEILLTNRPAGFNFQNAHNNFIAMVRNAPQFMLHAPFDNAPQITPLDRTSTIIRLNRIFSLFTSMRENRGMYAAGLMANGDFGDTAGGQNLNEQFRQLFQRLVTVVGIDGARNIADYAHGHPIHEVSGGNPNPVPENQR